MSAWAKETSWTLRVATWPQGWLTIRKDEHEFFSWEVVLVEVERPVTGFAGASTFNRVKDAVWAAYEEASERLRRARGGA